MMQEFNADCTINLHVEGGGRHGKIVWACEIVAAGKRVLLARKFLGAVEREEAELAACLFGLQQAHRLLQEKVELSATFPLLGLWEKKNNPGRNRGPDLQWMKTELSAMWDAFRFKRIKNSSGTELRGVAGEAQKVFHRKKNRRDAGG